MITDNVSTQPIPALRAWLISAEELLRDMPTDDPQYLAGLTIWQARHEIYMARVRAEGESE